MTKNRFSDSFRETKCKRYERNLANRNTLYTTFCVFLSVIVLGIFYTSVRYISYLEAKAKIESKINND